jgi:hypothetical protein
MKHLFILSLSLLPLLTFAQNETYNPYAEEVKTVETTGEFKGDYLLIPFPDRLFKCHFGKELTVQNDMSFEELRSFFQRELNGAISAEMAQFTSVVNTNTVPDAERETRMVHENVAFNYEPVPVKEEDLSTTDKFKKKLNLKKKEEEPQRTGTYIENGQVVTHRDTREKYLAAQLKNTDFLELMQGFHANQFMVMVNQLEIVYPPQANQMDLQYEKYRRLVRVHYTIFNKAGESVSGGKADAYVDATTDDAKALADAAFPEIAKQIMITIPGFENVYTPEEEK